MVWMRLEVDWRSLASGWTERSSESMDMPSEDTASSELYEAFGDRLRFLWDDFLAEEGLAHSGTGYSCSNCRRRRLMYSLPLTRSSDSVSRSLRSLGLEANDTTVRSSSLSTHTATWPRGDASCSSSDVCATTRFVLGNGDGAESRKKS